MKILMVVLLLNPTENETANGLKKLSLKIGNKMKHNWSVYLLRCSNNALYCGVTNNLQRRVYQHNAGKGAKYTKVFGPVSLVAWKSGFSKKEAFKLECFIKQLPKIKKIPFVEALG